MRYCLLALLALTTVSHAETWRWVDENGVVNYSDQFRPGAERVELEAVQTFTPPEWTNPALNAPARDAGAGPAGGGNYNTVAILTPQPEETVWNNEGFLEVALNLDPPVQPGDRINLYLDGERVNGLPADATRFTINRVFRGTHTLRATVENRAGNELASSATTEFFVQQTTVNTNPAVGVRPPQSGPTPTPPIVRPPVRPQPRGGG